MGVDPSRGLLADQRGLVSALCANLYVGETLPQLCRSMEVIRQQEREPSLARVRSGRRIHV
jgi:hypothetical protein